MDERGLLPGFQARPHPMLAHTLEMAQASEFRSLGPPGPGFASAFIPA